MYMMLFVWILIPVIINFKKQIKDKTFNIVAWIFLIIGVICGYFSGTFFVWDIGYSVYFLGYLMIGAVIRNATLNKKNTFKGLILVCAGLLVEFLMLLLSKQILLNNLKIGIGIKNILEPLTIPAMIASLFIFSGFSYLKIDFSFSGLSKNTFIIYLIHLFILQYSKRLINYFLGQNRIWITIPLIIILTFVLSLIFAYIYNAIWKRIEQKLQITNRLCEILKLN